MIEVDLEACSGCQKCVKACPFAVITIVNKKAQIGDGCTMCGACVQVCPEEAITIERKIRDVDLSKYSGVWVFAETVENSKLRNVTYELLNKGAELAKELGQELNAILLGQNVESLTKDLAAHGANKVILVEHELLEQYNTDAYANVLTGLISKYNPNILLFPATHLGRDLAPRIAATLELGLTADCTGLSIHDGLLLQTRPAFGGNIMADIVCPYTRPQMATVRPNVMPKAEPDESRSAEVIKEAVSLDPKGLRTKIREIIKTGIEGTKKIDESDCVISGGRGMCTEENFNKLEDLAKELDGVVGASRVVIDLGWRPKSVQVGQSGITVSPKLYFACGISGAIQHTVGMRGADTIVAINKDPNAPIFEFAKYGLVGDCNELVPLLIEEVRARKAEQ
ncbi:FAD-binding protein [[Eubacterium] cellulosolvens]